MDNLSLTTRIVSFLATNSNFIIKSTIRCVHSSFGISLNFNFPASTSILFFILWYISHPSTYLPVSLVTPGHQWFLVTNSVIFHLSLYSTIGIIRLFPLLVTHSLVYKLSPISTPNLLLSAILLLLALLLLFSLFSLLL